jgi:putative glycosyltransferase (TIGR04372 family)
MERLTILTRVASFGTEQVAKTIRRPRRLIAIPWTGSRILLGVAARSIIARLCRSGNGGIAALLDKFAVRLIGHVQRDESDNTSRRLDCLFQKAVELLDGNQPVEAWKAFAEGAHESTNYQFFKTGGICLLQGLGRAREGIQWYCRSDEARFARAAELGITSGRHRVLDRIWVEHFGHAAQVDYIVKLGLLEGRDPQDTIVYFPPDLKVANRFLVEQWAPHLRLARSAKDLPFPKEEIEFRALNFFAPRIGGRQKYYLWELAAQTYQRWHAEGRGALLKLPVDVTARGWQKLHAAGIPHGAWFVGLHVRDPGYHTHHRAFHSVLNAKIRDYFPAIEEITKRGGWVVRLGDPAMPPLPPMPNVLDYCHSDIRCDWMDVFLAATSRFFIGTASGVCYAAQDYGVPCVLTNWWPPAQRPWQPNDIFIPKRHRWLESGRYLTLAESLEEPFGYCNAIDYLWEHHGVTVQDNDAEDIRGAVLEMIERLEGRCTYDDRDLAMRRRAEHIYTMMGQRLYDSPAAFGAAMLARDFVRRQVDFLMGSDASIGQ